MICPNCGATNPDNAFYCGRCAIELRPPPRPEDHTELRYSAAAMRGMKAADPMVAVAINVRRIFILLGTTLLLTIWTSGYSILFREYYWDYWFPGLVWLGGSALIVGGGLWCAVKMKRVTAL